MSDPICESPTCLKPITDPSDQNDKYYLVISTGRVIAITRHEACAAKYDAPGSGLKRASQEDLKKLLSPASALQNFLKARRQAGLLSRSKRIPPK